MAQKYYFDWEDSPLKSLPENQIKIILEDYENPEIETKVFLKKHYLLKEENLEKSLPYAHSKERECINCQNHLHRKPIREIEGGEVIIYYDVLCLECGHKNHPGCQCNYCIDTWKEGRRKRGEMAKDGMYIDLLFYRQTAKYYPHLTPIDKVYFILINNHFLSKTTMNTLVFNTNRNHADVGIVPVEGGCENCSEFEQVDRDLQDHIIMYRYEGLIIPTTSHYDSEFVYLNEKGEEVMSLLAPDIEWMYNVYRTGNELMRPFSVTAQIYSDWFKPKDKLILWNHIFETQLESIIKHYMDEVTNNSKFDVAILNAASKQFSANHTIAEAFYIIKEAIQINRDEIVKNLSKPRNVTTLIKKSIAELIEKHKEDRPTITDEVDIQSFDRYVISNILKLDDYRNVTRDDVKEKIKVLEKEEADW